MAPLKHTDEQEVHVPIERVWASMKDGEHLLPKLFPEGIKSVKKEGDYVTFHFKDEAAALHGDYVKEKVTVDDAHKKLVAEVVECPLLGKVYNHRKSTTTLHPGKSASSTIIKLEAEIEPVGEFNKEIADKVAKDGVNALRRIEAYLKENPSVYA